MTKTRTSVTGERFLGLAAAVAFVSSLGQVSSAAAEEAPNSPANGPLPSASTGPSAPGQGQGLATGRRQYQPLGVRDGGRAAGQLAAPSQSSASSSTEAAKATVNTSRSNIKHGVAAQLPQDEPAKAPISTSRSNK